ncbi:Short-chain dehydrogenase TIC 32-like protein [Lachnellula hyalina]|uniref:Short-chain dehydrogenase TIC 32-like protein n=1 Tax=Lachnellula hyalina TaxID=1316788 RepID=A0A8H8TY70_9HELO|nr:Short-chain dehydrogenase TIC 32-like protein [Lachnellula hyalina]TVY24607.1 Short-chain dehydrogenase TIC 32-like protein [Lachnellula hyalina]
MPVFNAESTGQDVVNTFPEQVKDRTIVITGATGSSIGSAAALALASASPRKIILVNRNATKSQELIHFINTSYPSAPITHIVCDLSSLKSVEEASFEISKEAPSLDILVNNAATPPGPYSQTVDGIESQFAIDYVSHFFLTNLLMPNIIAAGLGARVVNVSSSAARHRTQLDFEDYNFSNGAKYTAFDGYTQAKLAIVVFTIALAKRMEKFQMQSFSLHPGSILSSMRSQVSSDDWKAAEKRREEAGTKTEGVKKQTVEQGCSTMLVAALDPELADHSGSYLSDGVISTEAIHALDSGADEAAEKLWKITEKLVGREFTWS